MNIITIKYSKSLKKMRGVSLLLGILLMYASNVTAAMTCKYDSGFATITASVPLQAQNITAGPDVPNGTPLYTQTFIPSSRANITCGPSLTAYKMFNSLAYSANPLPLSAWNSSPYAGQVYQTGVAGIGFVATIQGNPLPSKFSANSSLANVNTTFSGIYRDVNIVFIKTGPVSAGVIRGGDLPSVKIDYIPEGSDNDAANSIRLSSLNFSGLINIVTQTCQTPDVNVPMGVIDINKTFKGVGTASQWQDASIQLKNCPQFYGTNGAGTYSDNGAVSNNMPLNQISLTLTPNTSIIDSTKGIIGFKTGAGTASGVGLQLAYGMVSDTSPTPVTFNSPKSYPLPNDNSTTKTVPLVARYIQTANTVNPGRADATATFTINYY